MSVTEKTQVRKRNRGLCSRTGIDQLKRLETSWSCVGHVGRKFCIKNRERIHHMGNSRKRSEATRRGHPKKLLACVEKKIASAVLRHIVQDFTKAFFTPLLAEYQAVFTCMRKYKITRILCILLASVHIVRWCTVHTMLNNILYYRLYGTVFPAPNFTKLQYKYLTWTTYPHARMQAFTKFYTTLLHCNIYCWLVLRRI